MLVLIFQRLAWVLAYFVFLPVGYISLLDFHDVALSVLPLGLALYFAARDLIVRKPGHAALSHWRLPLFAFLYRNAVKVVDRFNLPPRNVVEIARKIEV